MGDIIIGLITIAIGVLFCFRGYLAMRVIIPIWGGFAGFFLGAGLVSGLSGDGFLGTAAGWILGLVLAVVFFLIAYLYYEISVIIVMASIGFTLGSTLMTAIGMTWSWLVIIVGIFVALLLAAIAIVSDLPTGILVLLTSLAGASAILLGGALVFDQIDRGAIDGVTDKSGAAWWWWVVYAILVVAGLVAQVRVVDRLRTSMRQAWVDSGGRELRRS